MHSKLLTHFAKNVFFFLFFFVVFFLLFHFVRKVNFDSVHYKLYSVLITSKFVFKTMFIIVFQRVALQLFV